MFTFHVPQNAVSKVSASVTIQVCELNTATADRRSHDAGGSNTYNIILAIWRRDGVNAQ